MKIINHYPSINSTGVFRNEPIKVYFDTPIDPFSIKWDTFSINDSNTFSSVVGDIGPLWESGVNLSGVTSGIVFVPTINLLANSEYTIYVYGTPNSIIAKNGDQLSDTYSYSFVTGTGYYTETGSIGIPNEVIEDSSYMDGLYQIDEGLIVKSITPINLTPNVPTNSGQIDIYFNIPVTTTDLSGYISVSIDDVLN